VENEGLVVTFVSQLEEGSVGVYGISQVRPEGHGLRAEDEIALKASQSA